MRKLRLDLDDLRIETFTTEGAASGRGTVQGRDSYSGPSHYTVCPVICGGGQDSDECPVSWGYGGECPQTPNTNCEI